MSFIRSRLRLHVVILGYLCLLISGVVQAEQNHEPVDHAIVADTASLTIVLDTVPDALIDVEFGGSLGTFFLDDDAVVVGGDSAVPNVAVGEVPADSASQVNIVMPTGYYLTDTFCDSPNALAERSLQRIRVFPQPDEVITCTFVASRAGRISVIKYEDVNGDGYRNSGEGPLGGWQFYAFDGASFNPRASGLTNSLGVAVLDNIEPSVPRKVCEDLSTLSAFANTDPGARDVIYNLPCKSVVLAPAYWLAIGFGNVNTTGNDIDGDRIGDNVDNCVNRANSTQIDTNSNGVGDICESTLVIVQDTVPDRATNFVYNGDLGWFVLDDDDDPELPATRSFGIETGSALGLISTTFAQTQYAHWKLDALSCTPSLLASVNSLTGQVIVAPTNPGQVITCTFQNSIKTRTAQSIEPTVIFSPLLLADGSVRLSWSLPQTLDVAGVDVYIADRHDGRYLPLFANLPIDASGYAIDQSAPKGLWYYMLSVRLTTGETLSAGPKLPSVPTSATLAGHFIADSMQPASVLIAIVVVLILGVGTFWLSGKQRQNRTDRLF